MKVKRDGSPRKVYVKDVPRRQDEIVLAWLKLRLTGWSAEKIAAKTGVRSSAVDMATRRVRDADIAESGDGEERVKKAYWRAAPEGW